jgi:hypothetical protein
MSKKFKSLQDAVKHFEEVSGSTRNEFFTLADHGDTATVRFLHEGEEDLDWYILHKVKIQEKDRWVKCTEDEQCPLCKAGNRPQLKIFLQLVDKRDGKIKTWERGQKFIPKIISIINRYGNLNSRPYDIERMGKKGDTKTDYNLFPHDKDGKEANLPERQELVGENGFILEKSIEDMKKIAEGTYRYEDVENPPKRESNTVPTSSGQGSASDIF